MPDPMKIRATMDGDVADVRVLMAHPMETGQRRQGGKVVPQHYIETITAELNGKQVLSADISQAISRNPVFAFKLKGAKAGDKLVITWKDNKGESRTDETTIRGGS